MSPVMLTAMMCQSIGELRNNETAALMFLCYCGYYEVSVLHQLNQLLLCHLTIWFPA